jgi:5-methylcytosine-specific restriction enzyme subunit McrC
MRRVISIREHGRLTIAPVNATLDLAQVGEADFDWLVAVSAKLSRYGARLVEVDGRRTLSVDNYVGVLELPSGAQLEIVPKTTAIGDDLGKLRALVLKMIAGALGVAPRTVTQANVQTLGFPLSEWLVWQYLMRLNRLIKRGIRFEYQRVEEECGYLRGQLDIPKRLRQPVDRQHIFPVRHDVFTPDRAENRLLRLALNICDRLALSPDCRRLVNILLGVLREIRPSADVERDLSRWSDSRLMADYGEVRPWCELIVRGLSPVSQIGAWRGLSMLFPMERLFERYVAARLERMLAPGSHMLRQTCSQALCVHLGKPWFALRPDILIETPAGPVVLDTKWKLLDVDASSVEHKYGLSQADFYQLFAYGQCYLNGNGQLYLIYPSSKSFSRPLDVFKFSETLWLWVVPFSLTADCLLQGQWAESAAWLQRDPPHQNVAKVSA